MSKHTGPRIGILDTTLDRHLLSPYQTCLKPSEMGTQWKEQAPLPAVAGGAQERGSGELAKGRRWRKCPGPRGRHEAWTSRLVLCNEALCGWSTGWGRAIFGKEGG